MGFRKQSFSHKTCTILPAHVDKDLHVSSSGSTKEIFFKERKFNCFYEGETLEKKLEKATERK